MQLIRSLLYRVLLSFHIHLAYKTLFPPFHCTFCMLMYLSAFLCVLSFTMWVMPDYELQWRLLQSFFFINPFYIHLYISLSSSSLALFEYCLCKALFFILFYFFCPFMLIFLLWSFINPVKNLLDFCSRYLYNLTIRVSQFHTNNKAWK